MPILEQRDELVVVKITNVIHCAKSDALRQTLSNATYSIHCDKQQILSLVTIAIHFDKCYILQCFIYNVIHGQSHSDGSLRNEDIEFTGCECRYDQMVYMLPGINFK